MTLTIAQVFRINLKDIRERNYKYSLAFQKTFGGGVFDKKYLVTVKYFTKSSHCNKRFMTGENMRNLQHFKHFMLTFLQGDIFVLVFLTKKKLEMFESEVQVSFLVALVHYFNISFWFAEKFGEKSFQINQKWNILILLLLLFSFWNCQWMEKSVFHRAIYKN